MIIIRKLSENDPGTVFELTPKELMAAYKEQQHLLDVEDVKNVLERMIDDDDPEVAAIYCRILEDQKAIDRIAYVYRHEYDKHGDEYETFAKGSIFDFSSEYEGGRAHEV